MSNKSSWELDGIRLSPVLRGSQSQGWPLHFRNDTECCIARADSGLVTGLQYKRIARNVSQQGIGTGKPATTGL